MAKNKSYNHATIENYSNVQDLVKGIESFYRANPNADVTKTEVEQNSKGIMLSIFWDN